MSQPTEEVNQFGLTVESLMSRAKQLGLVWGLRLATITDGSDPNNVRAIYDGDQVDSRMISTVGLLGDGMRVFAIAVPPAGNYVIGLAGNVGPQLVVIENSTAFAKADYPGLRAIRVRCGGGGGAGGGCSAPAASNASVGGGGGGGGYAESLLLASQLAASETVTVGAGGAGVSGAAGGNGGTTSFGALVVATGGTGGGFRSASTVAFGIEGGDGGIGTAGDIQTGGTAGGYGWADGQLGVSGQGGGCALGGGRASRRTTSAGQDSAGLTGLRYGGGGSGAIASGGGAARTGGDGSAGVVIVEILL